MSQSFSVECPQCHAKGELADGSLIGQAIACPACNTTFMVVAQAPASAATNAPLATPTSTPAAVGSPHGGDAHSSAPLEPVTRSSFQGRKPSSKLIPMLVWGSIGGTIAVWGILFLCGVPLVPTMKMKPAEKVAKNETRRQPRKRPAQSQSGTTIADVQSQAEEMIPADNAMVPGAATAGGENQDNIPEEIKARLQSAYGDDATPMLIEYLGHAHAGVRERAAELLVYRDSNPEFAPALIVLLKDRSPTVRGAAIAALGRHGKDSAESIPAIGQLLLQDPVDDNRRRAADALEKLADEDTDRTQAVADLLLPALMKAKADDRGSIAAAIGTLGEAGKPAIPQLLNLLKDKNHVDANVAMALAQLGHIDSFGPIVAGKGWDFYLLKSKIAAGLGRQKELTPPMLAILVKLASDPDNTIRQHAINALSTCEPKLPDAIPVIEKAQTDTDEWVRQAAAEAIAKYELPADRKVRTLLTQMAAAKPHSWERNRITDSIRQLKSDGMKLVLQTASDAELKPELRTAATEALVGYWDSSTRQPELIESLKQLLADDQQSLDLRTACAMTLKRFSQNNDFAGLPIEATLKQAFAAESTNEVILQQAIYAINREDTSWISILNDLAKRLERPQPPNLNDEQKSRHHYFRNGILEALAGTIYNHPETDLSDILPRYLTAINSPEPTVKSAALAQLPIVGKDSPQAVEAARSQLKHEQSYVRRNALFALGRLHEHSKAALPQVKAALNDEDQQVRATAAAALAEFGNDASDAIPQLIASLKGDEKTINAGAPEALAKIAPKDPAVIAALIAILHEPDLRDNVLSALQLVELDANAVPALRQVMPISDNSALYKIFEILTKLGPEAKPALPELVAQLKNPQSYLRDQVLRTIAAMKVHAADAVPDIIKILKEDKDDLHATALQTLRQIGEGAKSHIPELEQIAASTESESLKSQIKATIARLESPATGLDASVIEWLEGGADWNAMLAEAPEAVAQSLVRFAKSEDANLRQRAVRILQNLRFMPGTRKYIQPLLTSDSITERALGALLLGQVPDGDRAELAKELIAWRSRHNDFRYSVPQLLGRLGPSAAPSIVALLIGDTEDPRFRFELLNTFAYSDRRRVGLMLPPLREATKSDSDQTRKAALLALSQLNPREPEMLPPLIAILDGEDPLSQAQAARAISSMTDEEVDCRSAVPSLMNIIKKQAGKTDQEDDENQAMDFALAALLEIGITSDLLPELREALKACTTVDVGEQKYEYTQAANKGAEIARVIESLGSAAAEAIPDLKAFYERSGQFRDFDQLKHIGEPAIAMLVEMTESPQVLARRQAIMVLMAIAPTDERTVAAQSRLINDDDLSVRLQVASHLARNSKDVDQLLTFLRKTLKEVDENHFYQVLGPLQQLKGKAAAAVPDLLEFAKNKAAKPWTQSSTISALLAIAPESEEVQQLFVDRLKSADEDYEAANLSSGRPALIPLLIKVVEEKQNPASRRAAQALGQFDDKAAAAAIPALRELLSSEDADTKLTAAIAILRIDPMAADVAPILIAAFNPEKPVNGYFDALQNLGPGAAELLPQLIAMADGDNDYGPMSVIMKMGPAAKPAIPLLMSKVYSQDNYAVDQIVVGLGEDAAEIVDQLIADLDNEDRQLLAIQRLGNIKFRADTIVPRLLTFAQSDDLELRVAAIHALAGYDSADGLKLFAENLNNEDPRIARAAISAASQRPPEQLVPYLPQILAALGQNRRTTQPQLVYLLQQMGPLAKDATPALTELAQSAEPRLKQRVENALKAIQSEMPDSKE